MVYVALLRGINVSGHNLIKMSDLRQMFQGMGFEDVQTYIQSGNVLFRSEEAEGPLRQRLEQRIQEVFGFQVPVVLRTAEQMRFIVESCPFSAVSLAEGESLFVSLLAEPPSQEGLDRLAGYTDKTDEYRIVGREIYILCRQSYHKSKLSNAFFEQKLRAPATSRNWQTINKLADLGQALLTP